MARSATTSASSAIPTTVTPAVGFALVLASATLFGTLGPLSRFAYDAGMEPAAFVAWRALFGVVGALAFVAWGIRRGASLVRLGGLSPRARLTLFVAGLTGLSLNLCMFVAFDRITIALALLGFYTYPALVAVVNVALGRERLDSSRVIALALATLGMVAVIASQLDPASGIRFDALGFGLALAAALSQTVYVVISRDGYRDVPAEQAMTVILIVTVLGVTVLSLATGHAEALALPIRQPSILPLLIVTGLFAAAVPSIAFLAGLRSIGGTRAGILALFEPVVGVALAAWLLDESLAPIQLAGAVAILGAAVILQRAPSEVPKADATAGGSSDPADDGRALRVPGGP